MNYVLVLACGAFMMSGCNAHKGAEAQEAVIGKAGVAPKGMVLVEEGRLVELQRVPLVMADSADRLYIEGETAAAAEQLRSAASLMRLEAGRTPGGDRALHRAAAKVDTLAKHVAGGKITSEHQLRTELADASLVLAEHYRRLAAEAWAAKATQKVGDDLMAAANATEAGAKWLGQKSVEESTAVVDDTRDVAGKLIHGSGWATSEVGHGIQSLGREIEHLGNEIPQARAAH